MQKPPPLPAAARGHLGIAEARADLAALVADIRRRGSPHARPGQEELRERAATALVSLREERFELDGVRLVLVPARVADDGSGGYVVTAASYVRASLGPAVAPACSGNVVAFDPARRRIS